MFEIIKAKERSSVDVNSGLLIDSNGKLKLLNNINRGQIEIRQGRSGLIIKIGGIVGRLPVTETLAIDISPKFSMSNLARLMAVSDENYKNFVEIERLYEIITPDGFLPEILLRTFANYLIKSEGEGRHKEYQLETVGASVRPKLNFQKSFQTFWSKGKLSQAIIERFQFTQDNIENKILKLGCNIALSLCGTDGSLSAERATFANVLRGMNRISEIRDRGEITALPQVSSIPSFKVHYRKSVRIAFELISRSGLFIENANNGLSLPSYLINLDNAFESYIRNVLRDKLQAPNDNYIIGDGNVPRWKKKLFDDNTSHDAKPDVLIYKNNNLMPTIVGDVKYKENISAGDRYQIISHALSYQAKRAIVISPANEKHTSSFQRVGKIGPPSHEIEMFHYRFNLEGDLVSEEVNMCEEICKLAARND